MSNAMGERGEGYDEGWQEAIDYVLEVIDDMHNVVGQAYNGYDNKTLEELRQRIV